MPTRKKAKAIPPDTSAARREATIMGLAVESNIWLTREAKARGWRWQLIRASLLKEPAAERKALRGALVSCLPDDELVTDLQARGCAVVRLGRLPHPRDDILPAVLPDLLAQGRMAAEHFAERDFKDVAYYGHFPWGDAKLLYEGFQERAAELGMTCHLYLLKKLRGEKGDDKVLRHREEFKAWIQKLPTPVGVLASGAQVAAGQCDMIQAVGLKIPEDVAVLSGNDTGNRCDCLMPSISSIESDNEARMHAACDLLEKLMAGETVPPEPVMVPPSHIIERESTSILATKDRRVAAAIRYIWDHLDMDLSVDDVAKAASVSTRTLKRLFKEQLNRGVNEELRRKRLEELKRLLHTTDLTIEELAPLVGFRSLGYLHRTFRTAFGITPAQYRKSKQ